MVVEMSSYSDIGSRNVNEDSVFALEKNNTVLALVADGLGGHGDGDKASKCAVDVISEKLDYSDFSEEAVYDAVVLANSGVCELQTADKKMKTTIASVWIKDYSVIAANVGDTRIYHVHNGEIIFQSVDHSVAQMAVYVGEISKDEIRGSDARNRLTRALGSENAVKLDCSEFPVETGDYLLLCSDGFWDIITEDNMLKLLGPDDSAAEWLNKMHEYVSKNATPKMDNNTALVLKIS